ncbi:MAG: hypothetical protein DRG83_11480, partial [Deltaproteobacteria bacterium]
ITVALAPPESAPEITSPENGALTNENKILVSGTGIPGTKAVVYVNGQQLASDAMVDGSGKFTILATLSEGENTIEVALKNRGGTGPKSSPVTVTLDQTLPDKPRNLLVEGKEGGVIRISWQHPAETEIKGYNIYRSSSSFDSKEQATKVNSELVATNIYYDSPDSEGTWFYRVTTVDAAGNESNLSDEGSGVCDRNAPAVASIRYEPMGAYDEATGRIGAGTVGIHVTVTEPLLTTPFVSITPEAGIPIPISLSRVSDTEYSGYFSISESTPSGQALAVFSGRDKVGNRGTEILEGERILIDTKGPSVVAIRLQPGEIIKNDASQPTQVTVTIGLDEAIKAGEVPQLSYVLSGEGRTPVAIDNIQEVSPEDGEEQAWQATFTLPSDGGASGPETLKFIYSGADDLDNVSTAITCNNSFQVYQGQLPPLSAPSNLVGESLPGGKIKLTWSEVPGAAGYRIYRQAPGEAELGVYQENVSATEFMDSPASDGTYLYAVASIRTYQQETAVSGYCDPISVISDSVAPEAPVDLQLELTGQGIVASWDTSQYTEPVTFRLYRASSEITSTDGLNPVVENISGNTGVDTVPDSETPYYAVTAVDSSGNESEPSESKYLNLDLLPVSSLRVTLDSGAFPVITWTHNGNNIAGYNIYLQREDSQVKLNTDLITGTSFTDQGYDGGDREYVVRAVDSNNHESIARSIYLPSLTFRMKDGQRLRRGLMNRLAYAVENHSSRNLEHLVLKLSIEGHDFRSEESTIDAGEITEIPVTVPGFVEFPDNVVISSTIEITPHDGEKVEITSSQQIEVVDDMLVLQLLNNEIFRGANATVRFTLENTGDEELEIVTARGNLPTDEIVLYLKDVDGNVLSSVTYKQTVGSSVYTLSDGNTVARIGAGDTFTSQEITLPVPQNVPDEVVLELRISKIHHHLGRSDHTSMPGPITSRDISVKETPYYGKITNISPPVSHGDQQIQITGESVDRLTETPVSEVPIKLIISRNGYERVMEIMTDENGEFTYTFTPMPGEYGVYYVSVLHPDSNARPIDAQFEIRRMNVVSQQPIVEKSVAANAIYMTSFNPTTINLSSPRNYENKIGIKVVAGSEETLENVALRYAEQYQPNGCYPDGIHLSVDDPIDHLEPSQTGTLYFTIWADNAADEAGKIVLVIVSNDDILNPLGKVIVNYNFSEARPALFTTPDHIETGVLQGDSVAESITLENKGLATMNDVTLSLLTSEGEEAPEWAHLSIDDNLGDLQPGESVDVPMVFNPGDTVPEDTYTFVLRVRSENYPDTDIPVYVSVSQSGQGSVLFKIADIYTGTLNERNELIEGVVGARIRLKNEVHPEITAELTSDVAGEALFTDLQAGRYQYRVTAENHQEITGRCWIKPGVTSSEYVFLPYNLVTIEWEVVPTTIEDRYT